MTEICLHYNLRYISPCLLLCGTRDMTTFLWPHTHNSSYIALINIDTFFITNLHISEQTYGVLFPLAFNEFLSLLCSKSGSSTTKTMSVNITVIGMHEGLHHPPWPHLEPLKLDIFFVGYLRISFYEFLIVLLVYILLFRSEHLILIPKLKVIVTGWGTVF